MQALVVRGMGWKFLSQVVVQGSRLLVGLVVARLVSPDAFGVAAMVLVVSSFVLVFSDLALGTALVQRRELSERDRSTVFWTGAGVGLLFTLVGVGLAGPVASFYGEPQVRNLFMVFSLTFLVTALGTTQTALLTRELAFRSLELRIMAASLGGGVVGVVAAVQGLGAWAIILQQLAVAVISTALLWAVSPWRPRFAFSRASLRDLGGFSLNVFGTRLLFVLRENAGSLLVGRVLGAAALGVFAVSSTVVLTSLSRVAVPIGEVMFPALSRMQGDRERMTAAWVRTTRTVGAVVVPAMLGLVVLAPDLVVVVLGERWRAAVPVVQILAGIGIVQSLNAFNSSILMALDRTRTLFRYSLVFCIGNIGAFAAGLPWGIVGVATAYAIASALIEPLYAWLAVRALGVSPRRFAGELAGIVEAAALMAGAVLVARLLLVHEGVPPAARVVVLVALGAAVYLPVCAWRTPGLAADVRRLRGRRAPAAVPEAV
jgi:O-antigen/teichoic acid export membrane protein